MCDDATNVGRIQFWVDRLNTAGPADRHARDAARDELIACACNRLMALTRKIKHGFHNVGRWEQTEDVFQNAALRLCQALETVELTDARHFLRLAAVQIRRELIDMSRHYHGPHGLAAHHVTNLPQQGTDEGHEAPRYERAEGTLDPQRITEWGEFHEQIEALPEKERELFDLLWYHGLSQQEAADVLNVSTRTIKRGWREARLKLHESFQEIPGE